MIEKIKTRILGLSEWQLKSDIGIADGSQIDVGKPILGGWDLWVRGRSGRYTLFPIPQNEYKEEKGIIKGEIECSDMSFAKTKSGWETVEVRGSFKVEKPGIHSTSFDIFDPRGKKVIGPGHLYKKVISE
jgi:hypothetical protein